MKTEISDFKIKGLRASSAGNTFFIFDDFDLSISKVLGDLSKKEFVQKICNNFVHFYTDGVIFVEPPYKVKPQPKSQLKSQLEPQLEPQLEFQWDFYNSDGSPAEMCGNAARAVTLYYSLFREKQPSKEQLILFQTSIGIVSGQCIGTSNKPNANPNVKVSWDLDFFNSAPLEIPLDSILGEKKSNLSSSGFLIQTGVPHFVLEGKENLELARTIRQAKSFFPNGTNVTFVEWIQDDPLIGPLLKATTYERGVENFTLSCGTGAIASALYYWLQFKKENLLSLPVTNMVRVEMPGGILSVSFASAGTNTQVSLSGEVHMEFEIIFEP